MNNKHRAVHGQAMTLGQYREYVESHGHTPTWPPMHAHTTAMARQSQKDSADQSNQVPSHPRGT